MNDIAPGVWSVGGEVRLPGGIRFPLRMTVIRLSDGALWLHSPVPIDDACAEVLEQLGPVRHLVAPSRFHDLYMAAASARWPEATVYGPEAIRDTLPIHRALGESAPTGWHGDIEQVFVDGAPSVDEFVFFHRQSRSVIVTDLVFNFRGANLITNLMLRLIGCHGCMAASRSWGWFFARNQQAVASSVKRILAWPIERVIPCHGEVVTENARAQFSAAVARLSAWDRAPEGSSG